MCGDSMKWKALLLEVVTLCSRMWTPALASPMLRINCPIFQPLARPQTSPFPPTLPCMRTFTSTDDINMPDSSSIRHKTNSRSIYFRAPKIDKLCVVHTTLYLDTTVLQYACYWTLHYYTLLYRLLVRVLSYLVDLIRYLLQKYLDILLKNK
jgi:hypothetical protein